jgi:hypothetical protein
MPLSRIATNAVDSMSLAVDVSPQSLLSRRPLAKQLAAGSLPLVIAL